MTLDHQIDDIERQVKLQTLAVTRLIKTDGDSRDAERLLWSLMDVLSDLRDERFQQGNVGYVSVSAASTSVQAWA